MKVLMVGATGKYVSHVIPELKQRGVTIRALVRDKDKIDAAQQQGADEAVVGDLNDAESLRAAASEVEGGTFELCDGGWWILRRRGFANEWNWRG
jgi:uncharacterized protein YbjT (DUF2867 family)